jgi:hypothetical protein
LKGCFREIVLTDYTEEKREAIDPKLIVLAPFTLTDKTDKTTLLAARMAKSYHPKVPC